jgi:CHAD domain-containing protein
MLSQVPDASYVVAPGSSIEELSSTLSEWFDLVVGKAAALNQVVLDSADRRMRAAGMHLVLEDAVDGDRLVLSGQGLMAPLMAARNNHVPANPDRGFFPNDLPEGAIRDSVEPILGVRALLPIVELRRHATPLAVRNRDHKTVVRLEVAELAASRPGSHQTVPLATRLDVNGVLGYSKQVAKVRDAASAMGLELADRSVFDDAAVALGLNPEGVIRKPKTSPNPAQDAREAAVAVLRAQSIVVDQNLSGAIADLDSEFLHDLRVAVRRSRSVLRQFKGVFPPDRRRTQAQNLRWLQGLTGPTRDLDVQLMEWQELSADLPPQRCRDLEPVHKRLRARRTKERAVMRRRLRSATFQRRWSEWQSFVSEGFETDPGQAATAPDAAKPISDVAGRRIRKVYRRMLRDGAAIDDSSPATDLHDLRKRGKELRYLLESFSDLWPSSVVKPLVATLKDLQDVLGRHHDCEVQADNLRSLAPELSEAPGGAEALLGLGSVIERLDAKQHQARAAFAKRFAKFASRKQAKTVDATFRSEPGRSQ